MTAKDIGSRTDKYVDSDMTVQEAEDYVIPLSYKLDKLEVKQ